jgi:hypothetical protein
VCNKRQQQAATTSSTKKQQWARSGIVIQHGHIKVDHNHPDLISGKPEPDEVFRVADRFPQPFSETPQVIVSLAGFHFHPGSEQGIHVDADEINQDQFLLKVFAIAGTHLRAVWVNWIAYHISHTSTADNGQEAAS